MILRVSVTCEAGHLLSPADPADSRAVAELSAERHFDATGELVGAWAPRKGRAGTRGGLIRPRCRACHKFIAHPGADCRCGFDNAAGRYMETGSALLPF